MPTDMPRCETCRHWDRTDPVMYDVGLPLDNFDPEDIKRTGECTRKDRAPFWTHFSSASLITREDFGCIAHEPREG